MSIAASEMKSSERGSASFIQSTERGLRGGSGNDSVIAIAPSAKRNSYCDTQVAETLFGNGAVSSQERSTAGGVDRRWLQVSRRTAVTTLAVNTGSLPSPCLHSTCQCWLERLARTRFVCTA